MSQRQDYLDVAEQFTKAIANLEASSFQRIYADGAVIWHCNSTERGKQESIEELDTLFSIMSELYYDEIVREATETGFVQYHVVRGRFKDGSLVPDINICAVAQVADGKVTRLMEWFDPAQWDEVWTRLGLVWSQKFTTGGLSPSLDGT